MPRVSILATHKKALNDISIINNYLTLSKSLDSKYQYMIGEVMMLRLFSVLEHSISDTALKLACNASYRNGNFPTVLLSCSSKNDAYGQMLSYNRTTPLRYLQWTKADLVKKSIKKVLDLNDSFYINIRNNSAILNEMRIVRNHIAHRASNTYTEFKSVIRSLYGANPKISIGAFLTSTKRHSRPNIERYVMSTKIIINDFTHG